MAKSATPVVAQEALPESPDVQAPLDTALDELIGYAMRRAQ